jgi:hypothetical protein
VSTDKVALNDDRERMSAYAHIRVFESDCDRSQNQIRTAASTWIISAIAGIGIAYSGHTPVWITPDLITSVVCLLATVGLWLLWIVDQGVYQRLLHSAFAYGMAVEARNPDLPQIRTTMYLFNGDIGWELSVYYFGPLFAFTLLNVVLSLKTLSALSGSDVLSTAILSDYITALLCTLNIVVAGATLWFASSPKKRPRVANLLENFGSDVKDHFLGQDPKKRDAGAWKRLQAHQIPPKQSSLEPL